MNQLISLSIRRLFTEQSSFINDLIMTISLDSVPYTGMMPPSLDQIRYHCQIFGIINCPKPVCKSFKRKIWLYDRGDYDAYRRILSVVNWNDSGNVDSITRDVSSHILEATTRCIPNKYVTVPKSDPK